MNRIALENIGFYTLSDDRCKNASSTSPLMRCELVLTDACNFKCPYCRGQRKELRKHMSLVDAMNVVDLWVAEGLENIRFSGGEPTVWKGLVELVQYTASKGVNRIALSTNGSASWEMYSELIAAGVNDFSVSLDACCSAFGDKMAGVDGVWNTVVQNIKKLSEHTYTTVGIVVTDETVNDLKEIVEFAATLGVSDIRIISAAQYNKVLDVAQTISDDVYNKYPILKYRINNVMNGINVRGIEETDSHKCWIALDDMAVAGDYHYPCIIYLREQGNPIGKVGPNMREERLNWVKSHDTHNDPICKKNCLECIVQYNRDYRDFHGSDI
jgi:molybdenum cofactor biosynthesis enzyme MoaA